jgi:hypothetical protein
MEKMENIAIPAASNTYEEAGRPKVTKIIAKSH